MEGLISLGRENKMAPGLKSEKNIQRLQNVPYKVKIKLSSLKDMSITRWNYVQAKWLCNSHWREQDGWLMVTKIKMEGKSLVCLKQSEWNNTDYEFVLSLLFCVHDCF